MDQRWERLTFLHWRVDPDTVAPLLPTGVAPDVYDGSTWVGLIGFEMVGAGLGYGHPVPYVGTFPEINVRLYSVDGDGRRGVVFRSLEASRLAVVLATNAAGVKYRWSSIDIDDDGTEIGFRSTRIAPPSRGATTNFAVRRGTRDMSDDPLGVFLTARWGMHTRVAGQLLFVPNVHRRWPLVDASLVRCDDELLDAAGLAGVASRPPDSVLFSPGVRTQFGRPVRATPV
ncbi:YqjF family protein [Actinomycetes bacterium M1A6_2h]